MSIANRDNIIRERIREMVADQEIDLIECKLFSSYGTQALRCMIDFRQGGITIDVCAKINKKVVEFLNESKLLGDDFSVEINSPGLDRSLNNPKDFLKVKGRAVCLWLREPIGSKDYLEGEILDVADDDLIVISNGQKLQISFTSIKAGKEKITI